MAGGEPLSGQIPAGQSVNVTATFTAPPYAAVPLEGTIRVAPDAPGEDALHLPVVLSVNPRPVVQMLAPPVGKIYLEGANIPLSASAVDESGVITKTAFYSGATLLQELTSPPYQWTWSSVPAGTYSVTARAYDDLDAEGVSAPRTVIVQADSDSDGLGDDWEVLHFGGLGEDETGDYDNDGATNLEEFQAGTNPASEDSDGDGISDGDELDHGLNPLLADAYDDEDGDRYPNIYELRNGSDPNLASSVPVPHYVVDALGGGSHTTIQEALDAVSQDFQIVQVVPGVYTGTGNTSLYLYNYRTLLISAEGAAETVVDGENLSPGLTIGRESVVDGFTFKNAAGYSGAALNISYANAWITGCVLVNNHTNANGAAVYASGGDVVMVHCTLTGNSTAAGGEAVHVYGGNLTLANSILWNPGSGVELTLGYGSATVTHSCVRGGHAGAGNISTDPLLRPDGHLRAGAPGINAGELVNSSNYDMDGELRPAGAGADIGADEWVDTDNDGMADWWEIKHFTDLSRNGWEMLTAMAGGCAGVQLLRQPQRGGYRRGRGRGCRGIHRGQ